MRLGRLSQAVSEGDGISVIPVVRGDRLPLARAAEEAGAKALAVASVADVAGLRAATDLPLLVRGVPADAAALRSAREAGADACVVAVDEASGEEGLLEELATVAWELGLELAYEVRDEEELRSILELVDPDILVISERDAERGELELERTLDLLADVPAGKLVVSESRIATRDQVLELERAGVDAIMVEGPPADDQLASAVAALTGRGPAGS